MNTKEKELHEEAWEFLKDQGISLNRCMMVRGRFAAMHKNEYPHISRVWAKGEVEYYHSTISEISNLRFGSENEVILANAIYENIKEDFNINDFIQYLKFVFRILGIDNAWSGLVIKTK